MRTSRLITLLLSVILAAALAAPVGADNGDDPRFPTDETLVGEQLEGTFGDSPEEGELGHALGADLKDARISMPDPDTVRFVIGLWNLPPIGGTPEVIRYTWDMQIDGEVAQLDGKFTNYSRGVCDPTSGQCDPEAGNMPRDPGMAPFMFRGNLNQLDLVATTFNAMEELALIEAEFDVDEATITIDVPVEVINLLDDVEFGDCSQIQPHQGIFGGTLETMPSAFVTYGAFPHDLIHAFGASTTFTAPHALDAEVDCAGEPIGGDDEPDEE